MVAVSISIDKATARLSTLLRERESYLFSFSQSSITSPCDYTSNQCHSYPMSSSGSSREPAPWRSRSGTQIVPYVSDVSAFTTTTLLVLDTATCLLRDERWVSRDRYGNIGQFDLISKWSWFAKSRLYITTTITGDVIRWPRWVRVITSGEYLRHKLTCTVVVRLA